MKFDGVEIMKAYYGKEGAEEVKKALEVLGFICELRQNPKLDFEWNIVIRGIWHN